MGGGWAASDGDETAGNAGGGEAEGLLGFLDGLLGLREGGEIAAALPKKFATESSTAGETCPESGGLLSSDSVTVTVGTESRRKATAMSPSLVAEEVSIADGGSRRMEEGSSGGEVVRRRACSWGVEERRRT